MRPALRRLGLGAARRFARADQGWTFLQVMRDAAVDSVIDVGAYQGDWAAGVRRLGFTGKIVSYEPLSEVFAVLSQRAASDPLWDVRPVAVGDAEGPAVLNVAANRQMTSLMPMSDSLRESRIDAVVEHKVNVTVVRLANEWPEGRVLLKTDAQGADMAAVRGCGDRIRDVHVVQIEMAVRPSYQGQESYLDALAELGALGFTPVGFYPFFRDEGWRVVEFDCLLRRYAA